MMMTPMGTASEQPKQNGLIRSESPCRVILVLVALGIGPSILPLSKAAVCAVLQDGK